MTDFRRLHYSYARFALLEALRIANVNEGDSVLMPGFICRDVLCLLYTSPSPRDGLLSRMPSSA